MGREARARIAREQAEADQAQQTISLVLQAHGFTQADRTDQSVDCRNGCGISCADALWSNVTTCAGRPATFTLTADGTVSSGLTSAELRARFFEWLNAAGEQPGAERRATIAQDVDPTVLALYHQSFPQVTAPGGV